MRRQIMQLRDQLVALRRQHDELEAKCRALQEEEECGSDDDCEWEAEFDSIAVCQPSEAHRQALIEASQRYQALAAQGRNRGSNMRSEPMAASAPATGYNQARYASAGSGRSRAYM